MYDSSSAIITGTKILELGAATGALAVYLTLKGFEVITSDIDDGGEVEDNIKFNFRRNGVLKDIVHVPFTWGNEWPEGTVRSSSIQTIIASDILLYVK
jgi:predicted nicotinamide N-methyase